MSNKHLVKFCIGTGTKDIEVNSITNNTITGNKHFYVSRSDGDYLKELGYIVITQGTDSVIIIKPYDEPSLILGVYPIIGGITLNAVNPISNAIEHVRQGYKAIYWHVDDIISRAELLDIDITREDAVNILNDVIDNHDCSIGINWDVISVYIKNYKK